ncbi:MAG: diacylglycerol kinase family protein [Defluviitaleaceae bacterium]|nr:diacylglycerol kinase family protein [Defluviitaleaceae bacterium]
MKKNPSFLTSLGHAFAGIRETAARERNFRIQIVMGILAILVCIVFQVDALLFVLVAFAIFFVLAMELVNTAVEAVVDLASAKTHPLAKIAKDAAAGAVLLASAFAVIVGAAVIMTVIGRYL